MKNIKNQKGVSLISLIITIVVIIILASVTIYTGLTQNNEKATETKNVYEVQELLEAVANRTLLHKLNPNYYAYVGDNAYGNKVIDGITYNDSDGWYFLSSKEEFSELSLDNITGEYLVNYDTGDVVSKSGIFYKDKIYYVLKDLKEDMGGGNTVIAANNYDNEKGINKPILSKGMVPVKLVGASWVVTSSDDKEWYDYSSEQKAWANVMLMDELTVEGYDNEAIRNATLSDLVGKKVITEGSSYVWIPRYTATSLGETGSKIIFSKGLSDTKTFEGETYIASTAFQYEGLELTGIWVSKYEASLNQ